MSSPDEVEEGESHRAIDNPAIVMVDEATGNKYMRTVPCKGLGENGEVRWLIEDVHKELTAWGRPGGEGNALLIKTDGENHCGG